MMEVRVLRLEEIEAVLALYEQYKRPKAPRPSPGEQREIYQALREAGGCIVGVLDQGQVIGTCSLNLCPNFSWSGRPYAIIENVIVTKPRRGEGVGKLLLKFATELARQHGCFKVALMTGSERVSTSRFYESAGFSADKTGFQIRFDA